MRQRVVSERSDLLRTQILHPMTRPPEKKIWLQIWHPWKKLDSGPPPEKKIWLQIWHPRKKLDSEPSPPTTTPTPPPEKKIWLQIWHPWKKVGFWTPPPLRKKFDFRFGTLEKSWIPDPPLPPWLLVVGMSGILCCHLACIWGELKKFDTNFLHSDWLSASQIDSFLSETNDSISFQWDVSQSSSQHWCWHFV